MSDDLKRLLEERATLDARIADARRGARSAAVAQARALVAEFDLQPSDLFGGGGAKRVSSQAGTKVAPKYRDPATQATWTGRGRMPRWLQGKSLDTYLIK